ncbi:MULTISPECIES: hypothetical protein [Streptomycetaceae]|uniref:hypothetical protein n=1 Tax=Streptomycetaceae TaxID=2062 RepID=UPI0005A180F4|nr:MULTISPECIES: hypothetical protein [Streptomycetaceae]MYS60442.1 hypothetical protein [Streptomyces sp. SID5468]
MFSQIVTLIGVVVGALTSYLATTAAERVRHRRKLETRWDKRKLSTYIEYVTLVKAAQGAAKQAWENPEVRAEALARMEAAERKRSLAFEALVLLAHPRAVVAAHEVNRVLWQALEAARQPTEEPPPTDLLIEAMNLLHEETRRDLGVSSDTP